MRVCLLSRNDHVSDPRARALRASLLAAGHEVHVVACGMRPADAPEPATYVDGSALGGGPLAKLRRRVGGQTAAERDRRRALVAAVRATRADLVYPTTARMVAPATEAASTSMAVVRDPAWPSADHRDLVDLAPSHPHLAPPPATPPSDAHDLVPWDHHTPRDDRSGWTPRPGRLAGERIALVYRKTASNPGRYLEDALHRAGVEVLLHTERIDLDELPDGVRAVVFVESPYPEIEVAGTDPRCPVLFWVHHGEHHLAANLRLAHRYRADAVLLAHSWHLAHRFHVPVARFPFAIDTDLFDPSIPWRDRRYDAAMVGAHLREGGPYQRRQELVREVEAALPHEATAFLEGVSPAEMARAYGDARIVLNEGGVRHYPITMRVFEAVSAGALLLTDPIPGLDLILEPGRHFHHIDGDVATQVRRLAADPATAELAAAALDHARGRHTYDHRVDELLDIAAATRHVVRPAPSGAHSALSAAIDRDVEVQRLLTVDLPELPVELPDRELWDAARVRDRIRPGSYEAVVASTDDISSIDESVLLAARRYLYLEGRVRGLEAFLAEHHPRARVDEVAGVHRVDLGVDSYTMRPREGADR